MKVYVAKNILGVFALDEKGRLIDYKTFPKQPREILERLEARGKEEEKLLRDLDRYEVVEGDRILRANLQRVLPEIGVSKKEYYSLLREVSLISAKGNMGISRDNMIVQAVEALEDNEEALNLLSERIREWYSLHFPELNSRIESHERFVKLVLTHGSREEFEGELGEIARDSIGGELRPEDLVMISSFAKQVHDLYKFRRELEDYIAREMEKAAPNLSGLIGPTLAAKLISLAKGLDNLARMPGSRVQVLGAEKALFRHVKQRAAPPKHGAIFQHPLIKASPWWQRGKIARSLASKISIAARVDAFSGGYVADGLKEELEKRVKEVRRKYSKEPKRMKIIRYKPEKRRGRKRRR